MLQKYWTSTVIFIGFFLRVPLSMDTANYVSLSRDWNYLTYHISIFHFITE